MSGENTLQVDELLRNAELRTELEPYYDEAISRVNIQHWSLSRENDYLASMLRWERAPALPVREWFTPSLELPSPSELSDGELSDRLAMLIERLYEKRIVLDFTDHLSDSALYRLIVHDILPSCEKKIDNPDGYLHWDCSWNGEADHHTDLWLTYYANDDERETWSDIHGMEPPPKQQPAFLRRLPGDPTF